MNRRQKRCVPALEWRIEIAKTGDWLAVWCDVPHLISSGATVAELFVQLRTELEQAIRTAAARDPGRPPMASPVDLQLEFNVADPEIWLILHDPASCVIDMSGQQARLEQMLEKVAASERAKHRAMVSVCR